MFGKTLSIALLATGALALGSAGVRAQDAYVVGVTAGLTGGGSETLAPVAEGMKLYIDRLNAKGGVNGHKIELRIEDDQAAPSKAATNSKAFTSDNNVMLLINDSLSSTYAPVIADIKAVNMPLLFAGAVCPKEVYPPAEPLEFCSTSFGGLYDSRFGVGFVKSLSKPGAKVGFVAMAIPLSRGEVDFAEDYAKSVGLTPVDKEVIPPPTADYTPFATKLKAAGPDWVYSWAPWVTQVRTLEALRKLGWGGDYIGTAHINAEDELIRLKDPKFYVFGTNAEFQDNQPIHKEIRAAAEGKAKYPVTQLAEGWIAGMILEDVFKHVAWPPTRAKVLAAMDSVKVDTRGLRGGPIEWTKENHFRTKMYYRVYHWDSGKNQIVKAKDWTEVDVK